MKFEVKENGRTISVVEAASYEAAMEKVLGYNGLVLEEI